MKYIVHVVVAVACSAPPGCQSCSQKHSASTTSQNRKARNRKHDCEFWTAIDLKLCLTIQPYPNLPKTNLLDLMLPTVCDHS